MSDLWPTSEAELEYEFSQGGHVRFGGPSSPVELSAGALAKMLRRFSRGSDNPPCDSLTLENCLIRGELHLAGAGRDGAILPIRLLRCELIGGINVEEASLQRLVLDACTLQPNTGDLQQTDSRDGLPRKVSVQGDTRLLRARGASFAEELLLCGLTIAPEGSLDLSHTRLQGGAVLRDFEVSQNTDSTHPPLSLAGAHVEGDLLLEGVRLKSAGENALHGENLSVSGWFKLRPHQSEGPSPQSSNRCELGGTLNLRGARMGGQFILEATTLASGKKREWLAMMAEGADIGSDLCFYDERRLPPPDASAEGISAGPNEPNTVFGQTAAETVPSRCDVQGQINLMGVKIHGDLRVYGTFDSTEKRIRAFKAEHMNVDGDVHFGWISKVRQEMTCTIKGECDLTGATVSGEVIFSGSTHELSLFKGQEGVRRRQGVAVNLRNANIGGDLRCEGSRRRQRPCCIEGMSVIGATIGGRMLVRGAEIAANRQDGENRKAITANGSTIKGGIEVTEEVPEEENDEVYSSCIHGDFRLRKAIVTGPVLFRGADLLCDGSSRSALSMKRGHPGVALWASHTYFGADVIFQPTPGKQISTGAKQGIVPGRRTTILGELRFWGATIEGTLYVQGTRLNAHRERGVALDCYTATFKKGVVIGPYCHDRLGKNRDQNERFRCTITGIVSFNSATMQSLTIGTDATVPPNHRKDRIELRGALLMENITVRESTILANALLRHPGSLRDKEVRTTVRRRLKELGVFRRYCVVQANHATLGKRFYVRLIPGERDPTTGRVASGSYGLINLYGADAGTIGGFSGSDSEQAKMRENWGCLLPVDTVLNRGRPKQADRARRDILLNLDEFTYSLVNDYEDSPPRELDWLSLFYWFMGRPSPRKLKPRYQWLQRQVGNPRKLNDSITSPYRELARVYREMGNLRLSYTYTRERRWLQIRFGKTSWLQKLIDRLFSLCFGFGYSPPRALATLCVLILASGIFVQAAVNARAPNAESQAGFMPPHPAETTSHPANGGMNTQTAPQTPEAPTWKGCHGVLCPLPGSAHNGCHVPQPDARRGRGWFQYDIWTEGFKAVYPLTRFETGSGCVLHPEAGKFYRLLWAFIQGLSWIFFPLAAVTFSGVLRERDP